MIVSLSASVKYILVTSAAVAFSFLAVVKDVITLPAADVSLNCGALFKLTVKYIVFVVAVPKVSTALKIIGCASSPSPLSTVFIDPVAKVLRVIAPLVATLTKSDVYAEEVPKVND